MDSIAVIGSLNIDLVVRAARVPQPGETIAGKSFNMIPGGKGANQAVAASRAGGKVFMFGCVGDDPFGQVMVDALGESGVNTKNIHIIPQESTGTAIIIVEDSGENRIVVNPAANAMVSIELIDRLWESISKSPMILIQHEIPMDTAFHIIRKAYQDGITVILNPAPSYPVPEDCLKLLDVLIVNEIECANLIGLPSIDRESAFVAAEKWHRTGVKKIIVTLGSDGLVYLDDEKRIYLPAFQVEVVDTTAAGDTFVGAYAASILQQKNAKEALFFSSAAAALAVMKLGAQTSIPYKQEVSEFLFSKVTD